MARPADLLHDEDAAVRDVLIAWLAVNGAEMDAAWHRAHPDAPFEWEDFGWAVVVRVAPRDDERESRAAAVAAHAFAEAEHHFGPTPWSEPEKISAHLDRMLVWAARRTHKLLLIWDAPPETYYRVGLAPRPLMSSRCSWRRPRSSLGRRSGRRTRRRVASRDGPGREPPEPDPHLLARPGGRFAVLGELQ